MAHFYLTLPSNSSTAFYPNNTVAQFTTRLENSISLSGDWEVALLEIYYPHTWNNLGNQEGGISYMHSTFTESGTIQPNPVHRRGWLPAGYYERPQHLIDSINKFMRDVADENDLIEFPKFRYDPVSKRLTGDINKGAKIHFSRALCSMLGIEDEQMPILNYSQDDEAFLEFVGERTCDINRGFSSLYLYCDVLEHVPVGDTKAPLLRIVNVSGKAGDNVRTIYEKPIYIPLQQKNFDSIEVDIRSDTGKPVPFEYGKSIVTLHFRHCKIPYLLQ